MISIPHSGEVIHGKVMELHLYGKPGREDSDFFVRETERMIREYGRIRILVTLHDFHGWKRNALWEDWSTHHFDQIERLAVLGEKNWQELMTEFYSPFTTARIRYFTPDQTATARAWVNE